ncbi:DUF3710 domain-containing protein [Pseudoclavibacter sp. RFBG4]|uniref:DUF3710 domain-containing protein n=1 Tax=Pseudoclavibacter sp. RFBG4 TaxID=2080575 RepID=UPI000CE720BF|nr:DUF3710 domain-containing protein [Pseudoclavibacter sp. RFBG4]PPG33907.1 DUF3710 domain-containing protein [Pseudoclavibacter sp. RFBG4]
MGLFDFLKKEEEKPEKADKLTVDDDGIDEEELDDAVDLEDDEDVDAKSAPEDRETRGPFDISEASPAKRYVDLGALRIPAREGLGLRLEVEEKTKRLVAVALDYKESTMQIQAFAAPRSTGLWHSIMAQLAEQVRKQGGTAEEVEGILGPVLDTKIPVVIKGAASNQTRSARFFGVDGPRWFLRGVLTGKALRDEATRVELVELFRSVVVVRGDAPLPPRELLTLVVPKAMADPTSKTATEDAASGEAEKA